MTRGDPRHYVRKGQKVYWQPTAKMKAAGFLPVPLGTDGPDAFRRAQELNLEWDAVRRGERPAPTSLANLDPKRAEELTVYPARSCGDGFRRYRRTAEWSDNKAPETRNDWFRGWRWIKPVFGDVAPRTVTLEMMSAWRSAIVARVSEQEAHRALKIWRAMWKVWAALQLCERDADPSLGIRNSAPKGRSETWAEGEVVRLAKRAWRMGFRGLAAVVAIAWDTQLNPGDIRALTASQLAQAGPGVAFFTERAKTGVPVGGVLSARALAVLAAYLEGLGVELHGDAPIFRNRSGAPYSKDTLGDDFRDVRAAEFGDIERRRLGHDIRRSGAVEAIAGGANAESLSHAMGNTLSRSNTLFATYVPVNVATINGVLAARRAGRNTLRSEQTGPKSWKPPANRVGNGIKGDS